MSSSRPAAFFAALLGLIAVVAIPAAAVAAAYTDRVTLLRAVYIAVPVAFVAALCAYAAYRRARAKLDRSVRRTGSGTVRPPRFPSFSGPYLPVTGPPA